MTRILVADDHEIVRKRICTILAGEKTFKVCGEAIDGRDAVEKARKLRPDVVVMDISMPNMNGIDAAREITRTLPDTNIVVISQHETPDMSRHALAAGARAYVPKSEIPANLVNTIARFGANPVASAASSPALRKPVYGHEERRSTVVSVADTPLQGREGYFRSVMNTLAEGLYTVDAQGLLTYINPAAEAMFGWTSGELSGRKMHDVTHHSYPNGAPFPAEDCPGLRVLEKGVALREHEDIFIRKDGSFFPVIFSASPLKSGAGRIIGLVVAFRDDTKRRQTEDALQLSIKTLESRVSERTVALETASHELRELSGKLLNAQDEERRRIARELHDGVGQLLAALSMNLSIVGNEKSRLTSDARSSMDESAGLVEQASREIRTLSHLLHPPLLDEVGLESALRWYVTGFAERSTIAVEMQLAPGFGEKLPRDLALALFRIVQESLTNVHRHSGSSTALVIVERSPREIALTVKDVGSGMPAEVQAKIISGESSGVGLRGIRERIRQFGGRLELHSDREGTQVKAVLPVPATADQPKEEESFHVVPPESSKDAVRGGASKATILCIDDEPAGLLPRKLLLESAGYKVIDARSGPEGIETFKSSSVDVVLLDYWMSGMKGTAVASELKRLNPAVPIVVLSGMLDLPGEATGLVDKWIVKGSTRAEQLLESIAALLERRVAES